ncbi:MAG: pseudouridine synthase [Bdellovibrionota bacterium]
MRLQKWISQLGIASRREAERWIEEGRLSINGEIVTSQGLKVDPNVDEVRLDGKLLEAKPPPRVYWLLNKPDQVLTTRKDPGDRETIFDLPKLQKVGFTVAPVGRLDYRTEGLLLLSNDGELVHRLCHPKYKVPRHYHALISGKLSHDAEKAIRKGVELEDGLTLPADIIYAHGKNLGKSKGSWYFITVYEGRNRLVRRLFESFGHKVIRLIRTGFGDIKLPEELQPGDYRQLSAEEIKLLKKAAKL